jgi:hypothetical protein
MILRRSHAFSAIRRRSPLQQSRTGHSKRSAHSSASCRTRSGEQHVALDGHAAVVGRGDASGTALATLFLNDYGWTQPAKAYLPPALIERLTPFLPVLEPCAVEGARHFVATLTLNLLEVGSRPVHLSFCWPQRRVGWRLSPTQRISGSPLARAEHFKIG